MNIAAITNQMEEGLTTSVFPGAVLLVSHQNKIVFHEGFGQRRIKPNNKQTSVDLQTIFDLASLTKPLVTTAAIAQLLQQNR
ncbi:MAG: serine hydrolase domain-containing protein, partial [Nitrospirota bacterium]|nr:serine hydrolase domain-containing protein [Nitrospirota bacterium]